MGNFITLAEAKNFIRVSDTRIDGLVTTLIASVESFLESTCGVKFKAESHVEHFDGGLIFFHVGNQPLVSVTSIYDRIAEETLDADDDYEVIDGMIYFGKPAGVVRWPRGERRYKVTYVGGYNNRNDDPPAGSVAAPEGLRWAGLGLIRRAYESGGVVQAEGVQGTSINWPALMQTDIWNTIVQHSRREYV